MKKPKRTRQADPDVSQVFDRCETPAYAVEPLLPYLRPSWRIWEPACGSGRMMTAIGETGFQVVGTDILTGRNFFEYQPAVWDAIVTNPPYSVKAQWIERCYKLGRPFALLVPVETIGAGRVQRLMEQHGAELLLLDKRVNFHMPNVDLGGSGAHFPVLWLCWRLLPAPIVYGRITRRHDGQLRLLEMS